MTEHQHTPGPWEARPNGNRVGKRASNRSFKMIADLSETRYLKTRVADSRLIASAPDLLAVAEAVLNNDEVDNETLIRMARAALAKARGE